VVDLARRSGMNRSYLQTLMKKHGLRARDFRAPKDRERPRHQGPND